MGALLGCSDAPSLGHQEHPEGEAMGGGLGPGAWGHLWDQLDGPQAPRALLMLPLPPSVPAQTWDQLKPGGKFCPKKLQPALVLWS